MTDLEQLAKAIAIADTWGIEADNDSQRRMREKMYDENRDMFPELSEQGRREDGGSYFVRGKDHWRMLAQVAIDALKS